jgi:hypothetical protein
MGGSRTWRFVGILAAIAVASFVLGYFLVSGFMSP